MSSAAGAAGGGTGRRKAVVSEADRVFSRSSASFMRVSFGFVSLAVCFSLIKVLGGLHFLTIIQIKKRILPPRLQHKLHRHMRQPQHHHMAVVPRLISEETAVVPKGKDQRVDRRRIRGKAILTTTITTVVHLRLLLKTRRMLIRMGIRASRLRRD